MEPELKDLEGEFLEGRNIRKDFSPVRLCAKDIADMKYASKNPNNKYFSIYKFGDLNVEAVEFVGVVVHCRVENRVYTYTISDGTGTVQAYTFRGRRPVIKEIEESMKVLALTKHMALTSNNAEVDWVGRNWAEPVLFNTIGKERRLEYGDVVWMLGRPHLNKIDNLEFRIDQFCAVEKDDEFAIRCLARDTLQAYRDLHRKHCPLNEEEFVKLAKNTFIEWDDDWASKIMKFGFHK